MRNFFVFFITAILVSSLSYTAIAESKKETYENLVFKTLMREKVVKGVDIVIFPFTTETLVAEIEADGEAKMMDKPKRLERFFYYYNYYGLKNNSVFQIILLKESSNKDVLLGGLIKSVYLMDENGKKYPAKIIEDFATEELGDDAIAIIAFPILGVNKKPLISPKAKSFSIVINGFLEKKEILFKWQLPFKYPKGLEKILPDYLDFLNIK